MLSRLDLLLLLMVVIWGANFSAVKYALRDFPEMAFNAARLAMASAVFLAAIFVLRRRAATGLRPADPPLGAADWWRIGLLGLVGVLLYQLLFLAGLARTSVANSALIFGCTPVTVAIMVSLAGHERLSATRWAGAALSLAGIYAVVGHRASLSSTTFIGDALVFAGMLCWSIYSVVAQPLLQRHSALVITGWSMSVGTLLFLFIAAVPMARTDWRAISTVSWLLMTASSLLSLAFAYMIWYTAVQRIGSSRTAIYSNLTPIVAMLIAWLWLGEQVSGLQVFGGALILGGIAVTRLTPRQHERLHPAQTSALPQVETTERRR